jgi:4-alpha-glucanotransferase
MTAAQANDLDRLARALGVEPFYCDIWGGKRETSPQTAAALAAAMGFPAADDAEAAAALAALTAREWSRLIPPVVTATEGEPLRISLHLPQGTGGEAMWTLWLEDGTDRYESGPVSFLPLTGVADVNGAPYVRRELVLEYAIPAGYHRLSVGVDPLGRVEEAAVIIAPSRCLTPDEVLGAGARVWGLATQVYSLRSDGDWGMGDFSDLGRCAEIAAAEGADVLGLSPLHALFPADPGHCSPYSPSNRAFLNILYLDVAAVPEYATCAPAQKLVAQPEFLRRLAAARDGDQVNYVAVAALKLPVSAALYAAFTNKAASNPRTKAYRAFCAEMGEELRRHALFDALHEHFFAGGQGPWSWRDWPEAYRDAGSKEVAAFAEANAGRVDFFQWLQFEADRQLGAAAERARAAGMRIGFYRDLAVGADSGGSAAWSDPGALVTGAAVGAPPDLLNLMGQNWGLTPLSPLGLRERAYAPFIAALRANMRHAGALRIDHVMGLMHMFWLPDGGQTPGAYVAYPFDDILRIVALESRRNNCLVIGEDLGTVPEDFRPRMEQAGVLSYRVLYFERDRGTGDFLPPPAYPAAALATVTTHDLAPLRGFWAERDLQWRRDLGLYPSPEMAGADVWERGVDRWRLLRALEAAGVRPAGYLDNEGSQSWTPELTAAVHAFLAAAPAALLMAALEDATDETEQPNLPGTVDQHPNWRRRATVKLEKLTDHPGMRRLAAACNPRKAAPVT